MCTAMAAPRFSKWFALSVSKLARGQQLDSHASIVNSSIGKSYTTSTDADIAEMNAEMEALFGVPFPNQGSVSGLSPSTVPATCDTAVANSCARTDADIDEMNAEMEEVFGVPGSSPGSSASNRDRARGPVTSSWMESPPVVTVPGLSTKRVLRDKIEWCTAELHATTDVARCSALARCISECSHATVALSSTNIDSN